ncbi:hypothetical protein WA026_007447 [Henosepilachna vigintioctopunctata]|uniref:Zinc-hook domain-containing protein n=1 Tax=Henosepilachna vigintioctopunctata TaxID=420089 RepID=A0AAW1UM78_9CUCU
MATLIKLQISGIRSFGPCEDHLQQITFDTPVTLLVGQNGCGKTTIIEAIKYVCTGELPGGSSKGQGFVHYPKISDRFSTKGQIRLKITGVNQDTYTISKSVQLQRRGDGFAFSSLDSAINIVNSTGEKRHITGRCADIDKQCSQILQVSPCIINNVLFCHQENSSWPLDEGKKVKEKFDEIFDSKMYNKCAEMLTKMHKMELDKIKLLKAETQIRKEKKEDVDRKKNKLEEKREKCESISAIIIQKAKALEPCQQRLLEIEQLEADLGNLQRKLDSKIGEKKSLIQQQQMLEINISKLYHGSDEDLKTEISSFENKQREKERMIHTLEGSKREIEKKENITDGDIQRAQIKLGQLKKEKEQYELKCIEQSSLFEKTKISLEITDQITWDAPEDFQRAIRLIKLKFSKIDENLKDIENSKRKEESTFQEKIDRVREALATVKEKLNTTSTDIRNADTKILEITNKIQELDISFNKLEDINKSINNLNQSLESLRSKCNEDNAEKEILNTKKEISQMETRLEEVEELYKVLQENYIIEEQYNAEEQTLIKKKTESKKIKNKHVNNFKFIFRDNIPDDKISEKVEILLNSNEQIIKNIRAELGVKEKEVAKLETQIQHQITEIKKYEDELNSNKSEIREACQERSFLDVLEETYQQKEKLQKEKGQYSSAQIIYEKFIEEFQSEEACCPICETSFANKRSMVKAIIDKLKQQIISIPQKLSITEKKLRKEEQLFNKLQQLKTVNENIEIVSNAKLPILYEQLEVSKLDLTSLKMDVSKLNENLINPSNYVDICRNVITDATLMDQYKSDIKICEQKLKLLQSQKKTIETARSKHEVESDLENLKADLSDKRKKYETMRYKLDQHKQRCQKIKDEKNKQVELQLKYQIQSNNKPHLEKQLDELRDSYSILMIEKEEQHTELKKLHADLDQLNIEKINLVRSNNKLINDMKLENNKKEKMIDEIIKINTEVSNYRNKNLEQNLEQIIEHISQLEDKKKNLGEDKNETINKITEQKEEIAKQITDLRNLEDNNTLREKKKLESHVTQEITDLKNKIGNYDYRSVHREKVELRESIDSTEKEINNLKGQEIEIKNSISDIEHELKLPENKYALKNYKEKLYEWKITEKFELDIRIYARALHSAILEFHKERMVLINERLRELWRNIYKGNDVDYIQINAEECKVTSLSKKAYDYKVVQVKNGVELEMRGRCSAGQRVLACLIIRIALAESFSSHCGILALDEPTTNLDRENITSLTYAIANIITSHENDNNFQLLVITHDQEFLDILRHSVQNISHYWRISRNPQGYSIIKKERL